MWPLSCCFAGCQACCAEVAGCLTSLYCVASVNDNAMDACVCGRSRVALLAIKPAAPEVAGCLTSLYRVCMKEPLQHVSASLTFPVALVRPQLEKHEDAIVQHVKGIGGAFEETEAAICSSIAAHCDVGTRAEL